MKKVLISLVLAFLTGSITIFPDCKKDAEIPVLTTTPGE
jgi:hypothetical protein